MMNIDTWIYGSAVTILIGISVCTMNTTLARQTSIEFESWDLQHASARIVHEDGLEMLEMASGTAYLPGVRFSDGIVEVDIAPSEKFVFGGFVFRAESHADAEEIYVRLNKSGLPDAVQYAPRRNGLTEWQLFSGDGFTAPARFSRTDWIRLRAEITGRAATFFVDGEEVLVARLQREPTVGSLGLYGIFGARFVNFTYTPASSERSVASRPSNTEPRDPRILSEWEISTVYPADSVAYDEYTSVVSSVDWDSVFADTSGLVNIGVHRKKSDAGGGDALVFVRTTIESDGVRTRRMSFGYSDEIRIYLNGRPLFEGNSRWRARDALFLGTIGMNDSVYLDLQDGENELVFAVTEWFGGWGVMARLE